MSFHKFHFSIIRRLTFSWTEKEVSMAAIYSIHYDDAIMGAIASQITSLASVYSAVWLGADHRKHQSSASLAFVRGIHRRPVNSPHKGPVTRKMFPFDDVIMRLGLLEPAKKWRWVIRWFLESFNVSVWRCLRYCDVIKGAMASQITSRTIVYSIVHSGTDQRKHQSSVSLAFVQGIHRWIPRTNGQ